MKRETLKVAQAHAPGAEKEMSLEETSENIWLRAFQLSPPLQEMIEAAGKIPSKVPGKRSKSGKTSTIDGLLLLKFKQSLLEGACRYVYSRIPPEAVTTPKIYEVLSSSTRFGHLVNEKQIRRWASGLTDGFEDILEEYAVNDYFNKLL